MFRTDPRVVFVFGSVASLVLVWSGASKILVANTHLQELLYEQRLLPEALQRLASRTLPTLETLAGIFGLILLGLPASQLAFGIISFVYAGYFLYLAALLRSGRKVRCGCLSVSAGEPAAVVHLLRTVVLLVAALSSALNESAAPPLPVRSVYWVAALAIVLFIALLPSLWEADRRLVRRLEGALRT